MSLPAAYEPHAAAPTGLQTCKAASAGLVQPELALQACCCTATQLALVHQAPDACQPCGSSVSDMPLPAAERQQGGIGMAEQYPQVHTRTTYQRKDRASPTCCCRAAFGGCQAQRGVGRPGVASCCCWVWPARWLASRGESSSELLGSTFPCTRHGAT